MEAARKNALEILNGTDGGYVTFETNSNDQITELRIANNLDYSQATKCWRWNLGGLAYLSRASASDPWTVVTAATMDGGFVADFITTGTLIANNGVFELNMSTGQVTMGNGDFSGKITSTNGSIGGFTIGSTNLSRGNALVSEDYISCGEAGYGGVMLMGGRSAAGDPNVHYTNMGCIQLANSWNYGSTTGCTRIYGDGRVELVDSGGNSTWKNLANIP